MDERRALCRIKATGAAVAAIDALRAEHGEIVMHLPGGAEDAGSPVCLPVGELRVGARDLYLGTVHGVDVHEQASLPGAHFRAGWTMLLDLVPGRPPSFSLLPGDGMRFAVHDSLTVDAPP